VIKRLTDMMSAQRNSLQGRTLLAAFWSLLGSGGTGVIRFVSNLILTRLLFPEAFGLMGTAMLIMTLIQVFSDTGIKTALIQNPRGEQKAFIDTSFIIAMVRSLVLFGIVASLIQPLAAFYAQPELIGILWIMSFAFLAEGLLNPALPLLIKRMRIEKQVAYSVGSQFAGFITTLILVLTLRSVTALAVGYLMTSVFRVLISYVIVNYKPSLRWDTAAGRELLHFGKFIILNTMVTWVVLNLDRFVIGKQLGMEILGQYSIALYIGVFLTEVLVQVFAQSYFPALSSVAGDLERVEQIYTRTMKTLLSIVGPFLMLPVLFSHDIIKLLYDPRYALAGGALFWIGLRSALQVISSLQSGTLLALGKPAYVTAANSLGLLVLGISLPLLTKAYGISGSGMAVLASAAVVALVHSLTLVRMIRFDLGTVLSPWLTLILMSILVSLVYSLATLWLGDSLIQRFLLLAVTGTAALIVLLINLRRNGFGLKTLKLAEGRV
jgi:O-antigen/teichoic acid export membrane protein